MTIQEILKLYDIEMVNSPVLYKGRKVNLKSFVGGDEMEPFFDMAYSSVDSVNEIIVMVQHFIDGNNPPMNEIEAQLGGIGNYAIIYQEGVCFYNPYNGQIIQTVPLHDFKIVAKTWRDFLLQPPLTGE
jgi:hypothetical protein